MLRLLQPSFKYHVQPEDFEENKDSSSDKEEKIKISGNAAINSVMVISIMEGVSNISTFNISVLDETSINPLMLGRRQTELLLL